jgi:tryptophan halogenase
VTADHAHPESSTAIILGGGTAGFLTAIALRRRVPGLAVRLIRSKDIGIIGVGEGTTNAVVGHLHSSSALGLDVGEFCRAVNPIWKLGLKFLWGPRKSFNYAFGRLNDQPPLPRQAAYYVADDLDLVNRSASLITAGNAFTRDPATGLPVITHDHAYHLENHAFVAYLETQAVRLGTVLIDDTVTSVDVGEAGVERLHLASGRIESAGIFFDCSGFPSVLLGKALGEPFISYKKTLFCDRAVVGGWQRGADEPIQPYTTAQTMEAGWSWRIDHEHHVNRGYVYSSDFITDDSAEQEFRQKNPKLGPTRTIRFRSGRFERFWVKNVVAIGNASGFVEPMEATAIAAICDQTMAVTAALANVKRVTPSLQAVVNRRNGIYWDSIPRFLAVHYKFNTLIDSAFWRAVRADCDLYGGEELLDFYRQNGPDITFGQSLLDPGDSFGLGGYVVLLLGQNVPHANPHQPSSRELAVLRQWRDNRRGEAARGVSAEQALAIIRRPEWVWRPGFYK